MLFIYYAFSISPFLSLLVIYLLFVMKTKVLRYRRCYLYIIHFFSSISPFLSLLVLETMDPLACDP
jgi:hypothetical protein